MVKKVIDKLENLNIYIMPQNVYIQMVMQIKNLQVYVTYRIAAKNYGKPRCNEIRLLRFRILRT